MGKITSPVEDILQELGTSKTTGLTEEQREKSRQIHGLNKFNEEKKETIFQKVFGHMKDFTTIILLAAGIIALYSAMSGEGGKGPTDAVVIFAIVILNVFLAVKQELGAEKALDALKKMTAQKTVVIRNGEKQTIDAEQLVPGDVVMISMGDAIPADCRLINCVDLQVDEAMLTGESIPVDKNSAAAVLEDASLGDQFNMVFSGCLVTGGRASAVVTATGMKTEMGKIAGLLNETKKARTPLQQKVDRLCKWICVMALSSGALLFILQMISGEPLAYRLLNAVSLAVAAIPEGLPIVMTITLAYGITIMAQKNAIIRKMPAVESLGSASVICSDKTGTLTMNKMTVQRVWTVGDDQHSVDENFGEKQNLLVKYMALANNSSVTVDDSGIMTDIGAPTEAALIRLMMSKGFKQCILNEDYPRIHEIPFDSERKKMTTLHKHGHEYISITKGAFDRLLPDKNSPCYEDAVHYHDMWAKDAMRVLAVGYKTYTEKPDLTPESLEKDITFLGIVGMIDPPRPESKKAVRIAKEAGIKTVMITGDHAVTAKAIAEEIGIWEKGDKVITGVELSHITQEQLEATVKEYSVFARVSPEDKIRIVQAWQKHRAVVAMTGDGVNDAPALKAADIGVAMGSGTDVSKNASDMILTDDNFASIVSAVSEGRRVYDNIRKVLISLIPSNVSEVFAMILGFVVWKTTPFAAIQLLFINVVADGIPDLCMCREPLERDAMKRKPISKDSGIFAGGMGWRIGLTGALFTLLAMAAYYIGSQITVTEGFLPSHEIGRTMAYVTLAWASVVNIMNVRSFRESIFKIGFMSNRLLFGGICLSLSLIAVTAGVPVIQDVFHCVPVSKAHWLIMAGMGITPFILMEIIKLFLRKTDKSTI